MLRADLAAARRQAGVRGDARSPRPLAFSLALFEHARGYREVFCALLGHRGGAIALDEIRRALTTHIRDDLPHAGNDEPLPRELVERFVVDTFLGVLDWWLERRPRLAPAEVDAMFRRLVIGAVARSVEDGTRR